MILTPKLERNVSERILKENEPLRKASKLGAFLLQLSLSFSLRKHKLEELDQLTFFSTWRTASCLSRPKFLLLLSFEVGPALLFFRAKILQ